VNPRHRLLDRTVLLFLCSVLTFPALAALSPALQEWAEGPAQWLMTSDEKRAWRKLTTDREAIDFIDLFWARRDPSAGTAFNEFRHEFDTRVTYADERFGERRKRGALTDRGRVYIVLGEPTEMGGNARQSDAQKGIGAGSEASGNRQRGARDVWVWELADARQYDMSRIEVLFIEDPGTGKVQRDPRRADFSRADAVAIRKAVVHQDLTTLPAWAQTGGVEPLQPWLLMPTPTPIAETTESSNDARATESAPVSPVAAATPGASRLVLMQGRSLDAKLADPLAGASQTTLNVRSDAVWAIQYCSAKAELPTLQAMLQIKGPLDGAATERVTRQKDAKPIRIAALPGCYALQGSIPVTKFTPGRYDLSVLIDDAVTGEMYTVRGTFQLQ